jgi:hypothetical protein
MAIITLITDWNNGDFYLGALKGKIIYLMPEINIVDISHQLPAFGYIRTSFILENSYKSFPIGTIHVVGVNSEASEKNPHIAVMYDDHFFIGADNGIFGLLFGEKVYKAVNITKIETTFPELEVFADAAVYLAKGGDIEKMGPSYKSLYRPAPLLPTMDNSVINGSVIYIDSYSNVITNITRETFEKVGKGRRFEILVQSNHNRITQINKTYNETPNGELLALFNSGGLLEVSINKGNAADLLNLGMNSVVRIKFFDMPERDELKLE